jgi:hypothetical protein
VASANAASDVMAVVTTVAVAVVTKANTKAKKGPPAADRGLLISPGPVAGAAPWPVLRAFRWPRAGIPPGLLKPGRVATPTCSKPVVGELRYSS